MKTIFQNLIALLIACKILNIGSPTHFWKWLITLSIIYLLMNSKTLNDAIRFYSVRYSLERKTKKYYKTSNKAREEIKKDIG